ncbi:MAG: DUF438 domain-containing protein [Candidatus Izimaplasma sp.]|nr:DUF438 domain-containing protein [Candidatus Izimaplasma bacterium]
MSEFINNDSVRREKLKTLIKQLHAGATVADVQEKFKVEFGSVSTTEISQMEQELVAEGLPIEEVQKLCDVHATVFDGSIEDIHPSKDNAEVKGHPVYIFLLENEKIEEVISKEIKPYIEVLKEGLDNTAILMLRIGFERLAQINIHYSRKENVLFPMLEKHDITAPPKVMWGIDDEIRADIKEVLSILSQSSFDHQDLIAKAEAATTKTSDMVFKENKILVPLMNTTFSLVEWYNIDKAQREFGLCLIDSQDDWDIKIEDIDSEETEESITNQDGEIKFDAGSLVPEEINAILNTIPLDMTFVDKDDKVKYFTQGKERVFDRPLTIIGREVSMCHPPSSVHIVEQIVDDLRTGKKDSEDFWIKMGPMFVYIRYFAVRNKDGEFLGTLEVTQNIKPILELEGEKRLMSK